MKFDKDEKDNIYMRLYGFTYERYRVKKIKREKEDAKTFNLDWYKNIYLKTDHWQNIRHNKLISTNHTCESCGVQSDHLEIHHLTYERLYDERMEDLKTVCRTCHAKIHNKQNIS